MIVNLASLFIFGACWGLTIPLAKLAISAGHHPLGLIFWQMLVSAVLLGCIVVVRSMPVSLTTPFLRYYLVIALIGTIIPNSFSYSAARELPAGIMAVIIATVPIMSLLIANLFRLESFSKLRLIGVLLGVSALLLIALPDASLPDPDKAPWLLVALIAPLCYGAEGNYVAARSPAGSNAIVTLMSASALGCALTLPYLHISGNWVSLTVPWDVSRWALLGSSLGHVVAYTGYLWLVARTGAVFTSQISYVVTLIGVIGAIIMLNEQHGPLIWLAVLLMLVAISLVKPAEQTTS